MCIRRIVLALIMIVSAMGLPMGGRGATSDELKSVIEARQHDAAALEAKVKQLELALTEKRKEARTLANEIATYDLSIERTEREIERLTLAIEVTEAEIALTTETIIETEEEIQATRGRIAHYLRFLYMYEARSPFEIVLREERLSDFFAERRTLTTLQNHARTIVSRLEVLKENLSSQRRTLEEEEAKRKAEKETQEGQRALLAQQRSLKQALLTETKGREVAFQRMLSQTEKTRREIARQIYQLEKTLEAELAKEAAQRRAQALAGAKPGTFMWPMANAELSQGYGPTSETGFENNVYSFHNGIDFVGLAGAPIMAAADGIVKAKGTNGRYAYGNWVAVEHQIGELTLTTLYAHLADLNYATAGQKVARGELIGYQGDTGFATGAHLHFTVYVEFQTRDMWYGLLPIGVHVNPLMFI
ncbi:MAG: peptidoglycan DD-metalloendopeptidase family protein [Parcubacteria group bacterium]|nr:peptidoglycan DD-metalloendopeptidase family protein [Parcubacteria group bacterium]